MRLIAERFLSPAARKDISDWLSDANVEKSTGEVGKRDPVYPVVALVLAMFIWAIVIIAGILSILF